MEVKFMEQKFVNRFARRRAAIKKAQKNDKEDTEKVKKLFKAGYECPVWGPWLLELNASENPELSWKDVFEDFLTEKYLPKYKNEDAARGVAKAEMARMQEEASKKMVVKVLCKDNPNYKKEVVPQETAA